MIPGQVARHMPEGPVEFADPRAMERRTHGDCALGTHPFHGTPRHSNITADCPSVWGPIPNPLTLDPVPCLKCSTGLPVPCDCGLPVPQLTSEPEAPPNPHQP